MRRWTVTAAALALGLAAAAHAFWTTAADEKQLASLEQQLFGAVLAADSAAFARLVDPEYRTVNEDGSAADLREALAEMKSATPLRLPGGLPPPREHSIRVLGDTALITGRASVFTSGAMRDVRHLEVWHRRNGAWRFVHWHATRVQPEGEEREKRFKAAAAGSRR